MIKSKNPYDNSLLAIRSRSGYEVGQVSISVIDTNLQIKTLMLGYAFNYVENVYFDIGKNNIRSRKAIEKIGATRLISVDT